MENNETFSNEGASYLAQPIADTPIPLKLTIMAWLASFAILAFLVAIFAAH